MTLNNDEQLQALKDFASSESKQQAEQLEEILNDVAKTGQYIFPWHFMKPLYAHKLEKVTSEFLHSNPPLNEDGSPNSIEIEKLNAFREELLDSFSKFSCAPFTLQRVTELLTNPNKHYKKTTKFFRGLEKNIMVVSTMEMVTQDTRTLLKRQYNDLKVAADFDRDSRPPLMKRVAIRESGNIYSDYIDRRMSDTAEFLEEKEDVDVLSTTDHIDDVATHEIAVTNSSLDDHSDEEEEDDDNNHATMTEELPPINNGDTNGTCHDDEHLDDDDIEENLQSHEAMD